MNENKVCFITCANNAEQYAEARLYLERQYLPEGMTAEFRVVENAESMTAGYNAAMKSSDAKYKAYLHQDVCIVNLLAIKDCIQIFQNNKECGLLGMVGCHRLPQNGIWWGAAKILGLAAMTLDYGELFIMGEKENIDIHREVQVIDGIFMMTQYDLPWREDIFKGWHFYDISQSMEFIRAGYTVGVPVQKKPWCIHDAENKVLTKDYHYWRQEFLKEYGKEIG